jgi:hypothetical protein
MIKRHQTRANIGVGLGILLLIGSAVASAAGESSVDRGVIRDSFVAFMFLSIVLGLAGAVFYLWGCVNYAQGKGYSGWVGLLGLLSILGLIILAVMPDRRKHGEPPPLPNLPPDHYPPPPRPPNVPSHRDRSL